MIGLQKVNLSSRSSALADACRRKKQQQPARRAAQPRLVHCSASGDASSSSQEQQHAQQQQPRVGRRQLINMAGATAMAALCPCGVCNTLPASAGEWDYMIPEVRGPQRWGGECAVGVSQSPVDLPYSKMVQTSPDSAPFEFDYPETVKAAVINSGHGTPTTQIPPGTFFSRVAGRKLELLQFHFHSPSEHTLDGNHHSMEAHLVHRDVERGNLCVLGVMMQRDGTIAPLLPNQALQWALQYGPKSPAEPAAQPPLPVLVNSLLPKPNEAGRRPYMRYQGSLTTPPCSEQVDWFVFTDPILVSDKQVLDFMSYAGKGRTLGFNNREPQPIDGRSVRYLA